MTRKARFSFWLGISIPLAMLVGAAVAAFAGSSGVSSPSASNGRMVTAAVSAFQRPRVTTDTLPAAVASQVETMLSGQDAASPDTRLGEPQLGSSRLLIAAGDGADVSLYAVPTSNGYLCIVLSRYGGSGCFNGFTQASPIAWDVRDVDQVGSGEPAIVDGVAPSDARSVDVIVGTDSHRATLRGGGFFYGLPTPTSWPDSLRVTFSSGATRTVEIAPQAPSG